MEPVAVHGDRLALCGAFFSDRRDNDIVALQMLTLNEEGVRTSCVSFDDEDLAGATGEFEAQRRTE